METIKQKIQELGGYQAVAEKLGVDLSTVYRHSHGRMPTLEIAMKYKDIGIDPALFMLKNSTPSQPTTNERG